MTATGRPSCGIPKRQHHDHKLLTLVPIIAYDHLHIDGATTTTLEPQVPFQTYAESAPALRA